MTGQWKFVRTGIGVQGRDLAEDNFASEERSGIEILVRETLQNGLDARQDENLAPVHIVMSVVSAPDPDYLNTLLTEELLERHAASLGDAKPLDTSNAWLLLIEDFGTIGLRGTYDDPDVDGDEENWNAFWFREGEGAKGTAGGNGRAGQGKVTYYRTSSVRTVFGLTKRSSDGRELLMGRSSFRGNYRHNDKKYERHSFWGEVVGDKIMPLTDSAAIDQFRKGVGLTRKDEPGLSLVVPMPHDFDESVAKRTVVSDFYFPIIRGRLEVTIQGTKIDSTNIDEIADVVLPDKLARESGSSFTKAFRDFAKAIVDDERGGVIPVQLNTNWNGSASISETAFPAGAVETLRAALESGGRIAVRCPVQVHKRNKAAVPSHFDVHLQIPDNLDRVEEATLRKDLVIGSERALSKATHLQKARGAVIISDAPLSALLADAEEPTHMKWNARRPRLVEEYHAAAEVIRSVRQALPRLLAFLSGLSADKDTKALARYFAKPASTGKKSDKGAGQKGKKGAVPGGGGTAATPKPLSLVTDTDSVRVLPNGTHGPKASDLPLTSCVLELAYEGLDGDPFAAYDPMDFDLSDATAHPCTAVGVKVSAHDKNKITFDVVDTAFELKVGGFNKNMRLRCRLRYPEIKPPAAPVTAAGVVATDKTDEVDETEETDDGSADNDKQPHQHS